MRRILVTGSRRWTDMAAVWNALAHERIYCGGDMLIMHGCATGADTMADEYAKAFYRLGVNAERHPARWSRPCDGDCRHGPRQRNGKRYCPRAGALRNQEMVDLKPAVCLAFPLKDSIGTYDCMIRASRARIPVVTFYPSLGFDVDEFIRFCESEAARAKGAP